MGGTMGAAAPLERMVMLYFFGIWFIVAALMTGHHVRVAERYPVQD